MQNQLQQGTPTPSWWTEDHTQGWDRVREAFRRDWEQTKADFSKTHGHQLDQQVGDTVKQAFGSEPIPDQGRPNHAPEFPAVEPAYRFGYGARQQYGRGPVASASPWDAELEGRLEREWFALGTKQTWAEAKPLVRKAWDSDQKKA